MINGKALIDRFEAEMAKVQRPGMDKLMAYIRKSDFYRAPASTKYHLSCEHGLLQHSLNVLDALRGMLIMNAEGKWEYRVAEQVVDTLDDENVIIMALLHDLCKTYFYSTSTRNAKNEKTGKWEKIPFYTVKDRMPLGHGCKSAMLAMQYIELTNKEMYGIWWHMGYTDGQDVMALNNAIDQHPIIWALHTADMMASRMMEADTDNVEKFRQLEKHELYDLQCPPDLEEEEEEYDGSFQEALPYDTAPEGE